MSTAVNTHKEGSCECLGFNNISLDHTQRKDGELRPAINEVDEILVNGMKHLSFDELQREQEDLHGVSQDISVENPEEIERKLMELEDHLQHLKPGSAYESAEAMNQDFCRNKAFRMTFLAANRYNPRASADQMMRYFKMKLGLFPREKLVKEITLDDLNEDDIECLLGGSYQISRIKDRSNRVLLLHFPGLRAYKSLNNELRARYYVHWQMIKSLDPSRGIVIVQYAVGRFRDSMLGSGLIENTMMGMAMPFHIAGIHICMDENQKEALVAKAAIAVCNANMKAKLKIHTGTDLECQYLLSTYGIPRAALPISTLPRSSNDSILEHQLSWYQERLRVEKGGGGGDGESSSDDTTTTTAKNYNNSSSSLMLTPNENDVLYLGKIVNNAGNERLRALVAKHAETYHTGSSKDKRTLIELVMETIPTNGGRFLKPCEEGIGWSEVPTSQVRSKISQMFRNQNRVRVSVQKMSPAEEEGPLITAFSENDVLFGRYYEHAGNQQLRQLVETMVAEYNDSKKNRGRKKEIVELVVAKLKRNGGRFLKPAVDGSGKWIQVSDEVAGYKVSCHFRNFRRKSTTTTTTGGGDDK